MIHYITTNGLGNPTVGNELQVIMRSGIPVVLHSLRPPSSILFASPDMEEFCQANAGAEAIPAAVTGRATVYSWQCDGETPAIVEQVFTADEQGYLAAFWYELTPPE